VGSREWGLEIADCRLEIADWGVGSGEWGVNISFSGVGDCGVKNNFA